MNHPMHSMANSSSKSRLPGPAISWLLLAAVGCTANSRLAVEAERLHELEVTRIDTQFERKNDWRKVLPAPTADPRREIPVAVVRRVVELHDADGNLVARSAPQRIERSDDLVRLRGNAAGEEWVIARNPVATDRVLASSVDHAARLILDLAESELGSVGLPAAFSTFATCLVDPALLAIARPMGEEVEAAFGLEFRRLAVGVPGAPGSVELWWNADWSLPLRVIEHGVDGGSRTTRFAVLDRGGAQPSDPRPVLERRYVRLDLCDWRERICACADSVVRSR
ncbi:MAG: hypothetical protein AB7I19_12670 [Planctomycetota bacterium]